MEMITSTLYSSCDALLACDASSQESLKLVQSAAAKMLKLNSRDTDSNEEQFLKVHAEDSEGLGQKEVTHVLYSALKQKEEQSF